MGTSYGYLFYYLDFYIVDIAMFFFPIGLKVIAVRVACNPGNKMKPTLLGFWILKMGMSVLVVLICNHSILWC
jgi:hypothetical protein